MSDFLIVVLAISGIVVLYLSYLIKKNYNLVSENSNKIVKVKKLNEAYAFHNKVKSKIEIDYYVKSKTELTRLNFDDLIKNLIKDNTNNLALNLEYIIENEEKYEKYIKRYKDIKDITPPEVIAVTNIRLKTFNFIEKRIFKNLKLKPIIKSKAHITVKFTGSNTKSKYQKDKTFNFDDLKTVYNELKEEATTK